MTEPIPTAEVIHQLLVDGGLDDGWSVFVGLLPVDPDDAIAVYDTAGMDDGRIFRTGERVVHPGFQIQIRSVSYQDALAKTQAIALMLDTQHNTTVVVDGQNYVIRGITRTGDILTMGLEDPDRPRQYFSLNAIATIDKT